MSENKVAKIRVRLFFVLSLDIYCSFHFLLFFLKPLMFQYTKLARLVQWMCHIVNIQQESNYILNVILHFLFYKQLFVYVNGVGSMIN